MTSSTKRDYPLEIIQHKSTKFILSDYKSDYKQRLISLNLLPITLWLELMDIMFLITCLKHPQDHFDIYHYVKFVSSCTRSSQHKLKCLLPPSKSTHFNFIYFHRVTKIWNALPIIDLDLSIPSLKRALRSFLWQYFIDKFSPTRTCTWHLVCPCYKVFTTHTPNNFTHLFTSQ